MGFRFRIAVSASVVLHVAAGLGASRSLRPAADPPISATRANLTGDTLDVNQEGDLASAGENSTPPTAPPSSSPEPAPDSEPESATAAADPAPRPMKPSGRPVAARAHPKPRPGVAGAETPLTGEGGEGGLFGAVGERGAVDLAAAFKRQFSLAASADTSWASLPFGEAGETDVSLVLDASGKLVQTTVSPSATTALKNSIARTVTLIRGRQFTSASARTRLHIRAAVSHQKIDDGLHGDRFAIGVDGTVFFALPTGRRIDFKITGR